VRVSQARAAYRHGRNAETETRPPARCACEMGKVVAAKDWSETPLGPVKDWPQSLRTAMSLCLASFWRVED